MRMAPEGSFAAVQLTICCGAADRARKLHPSLPLNKECHLKMPGPRRELIFPKMIHSTFPTLGFRWSQLGVKKTSLSCTMSLCYAFVAAQNGTGGVEVATAWLTCWPKIITRPCLLPGPQAVPLLSQPANHELVTQTL